MKSFKDFGIKPTSQGMQGDHIKIDRVLNREIIVMSYKVGDSKFKDKGGYDKRLDLQIKIDGVVKMTWAGSKYLVEMIEQVPPQAFPFTTTIIKDNNDSYQFS